jgi:hypothetical protein
MMDNMAYQPGRGNWVIHEDGDGADLDPRGPTDLLDCLADGADDDGQTDGCIRVGSLNDPRRWTGGIFRRDWYAPPRQHPAQHHRLRGRTGDQELEVGKTGGSSSGLARLGASRDWLPSMPPGRLDP